MPGIGVAKPGDHWRIPEIWDGDRCFIIGGGMGVKDFDIERLRGRARVFTVNSSYKDAMFADAHFYNDCEWMRRHGKLMHEFKGFIITTCQQDTERDRVHVMQKVSRPFGISTNPTQVRWNLSSGGCAIGIAAQLGSKDIVLVGFNMKRVGKRTHYHDDYGPKTPNYNPYPHFLQSIRAIAADAHSLGIRLRNCTADTAIPTQEIEQVTPEEVYP